MTIARWDGPQWKPSKTAGKIKKHKDRVELKGKEDAEKAEVRRRDPVCRFPMCGCKKFGLRLEVSHDFHKGTNGAATKEAVSIASLMIRLCVHRHQDGAISRHRQTLRTLYLTPDHNDGPVRWLLDAEVLARNHLIHMSDAGPVDEDGRYWFTIDEEERGRVGPLTPLQLHVLRALAEMDL